MHSRKLDITRLCFLICLTFCPGAVMATPPVEIVQEPATDSSNHPSAKVSLELVGGMIQNYWEPGLSSNLVDFEAEGLTAWWAAAQIQISGQPVFSVRYDRPFQSTPEQEEMLRVALHQETGFEEFVAFLDLLPITSRFMEKRPGFAAVIRALASTRLIYSRNLFFGHTSSNVDFAYLPMDVDIDRSVDPPLVNGYYEFQAHEPLNFKTEFSDFHVMVPVVHKVNQKNQESVLRIGYFRSRWEKPSESVYATLEDDPIIQDTRLDTEGISGSYEDGLFDPGWGWRVDSDWGILGAELTSPVDNEAYLKEDEGITYISFSGELRWNVQLLQGSPSLWATIGARGQFRHWSVWRAQRNSAGEVVDTKRVRDLDQDRLYQVFATIRVRI